MEMRPSLRDGVHFAVHSPVASSTNSKFYRRVESPGNPPSHSSRKYRHVEKPRGENVFANFQT